MNIYDIESPEDIQGLSVSELKELAAEIRNFLIESIAKTGGHLSSNLGVVELSLAMHYVFRSPIDKLIFDVGHQSYVHKILTGRINDFKTLRQFKGMSGFQKRRESIHDVWEAGHSSTSLSAALGMAIARDLRGETHQVAALIGDGALSSGMSMEALNQIGSEGRNMVIIFNDNNMSISQNVGAMDEAFTKLRTSKPYNNLKHDVSDMLSQSKAGNNLLKGMRQLKNTLKENVVDTSIFGEFNLDYIGPVDGHDLRMLIKVLEIARKHKGPIVVHVITKKGKGYSFAEEDKEGIWHGVSSFDPKSGKTLAQMPPQHASWSEVIAEALIEAAKQDERILALTPAMISGSKLNKFFSMFPERSFDCGIAEEHCVTLAAALAQSGMRPFVSVYSSFMQRAYDQIQQDAARMDLPVVFGIDRCGLVGEDGETHHGVFDISMLRAIPNMILSQPKDSREAQALLKTAFVQNHPFAIRYPRGSVKFQLDHDIQAIPIGSWTIHEATSEDRIVLITYGSDVDKMIAKAEVNQLPVSVVNARFFKPLDEQMMQYIAQKQCPIIIYESDILIGGLSSAILEYYNDHHLDVDVKRIGIQDHFVQHGSLPQLRKSEHIDINSVFQLITELLCD
ncbi:1-deoxy-D-xylulose-5-phosphate synthase [bacterium c-19]|nr:1-deoxy-D-xylulose-5-phosphate synthase [bacterium c-19]